MLILTRKPSQELIIDGDIRVIVVSVTGGRVRLAIEAPSSVLIRRAELCWDQSPDEVSVGASADELAVASALGPVS